MRIWLLCLGVLIGTILTAEGGHGVLWRADLRPGGVILTLDTLQTPSNLVFDSASFTAEFFAGSTRLGATNLSISGAEIFPGQQNQLVVPHRFSAPIVGCSG